MKKERKKVKKIRRRKVRMKGKEEGRKEVIYIVFI